MKFTTLSLFGALMLLLVACGETKTSSDQLVPSTPNSGPAGPETSTVVNTPSAAPGGQVAHYICPNNCANSGADQAGNCPVCGTQLLHNQAYHNQANPSTNITTTPQIQQQQQQPSPAQNAAGEYHYVCADGHAGGSGTAGACATCGKTLIHNAAYHN